MKQLIEELSTVFDTYEEREEAFRSEVAFKLARRYAGPSVFWQDFSRIAREGIVAEEDEYVAYIPSNPRDCLAFGTPYQVLMASAITAKKQDSDVTAEVTAAAHDFGIAEQLAQPIRTLSGGETVKLALAKSFLGLSACSRMVIASPFTWLSAANRHLLKTIATEADRLNKHIALLVLAGEENLTLIDKKDPFMIPSPDTIPFALKLKNIRIPLSLALNPLASKVSYAAIQNTSLQLASPCVVVGENGQGKSLVARTLAGAITAEGEAVITSDQKASGPVCLLFQDVLVQTLLRSFNMLASGGVGGDKDTIRRIYEEMRENYGVVLNAGEGEDEHPINEWDLDQHVLLDIKTILVASRLASAPTALILDEPDWGLSRKSAIAFVSAVMATAHAQGTPVVLISHKPWWQSIAKSKLLVSRTARSQNADLIDSAFSIIVSAEEVSH